MIWVDWIIVGIVALSAAVSIMRGFVSEAMSLGVWFLAVVVAMLFADQLAAMMVDQIATPSLRRIAAFGGLFLLTLVIGSLVARLLSQLIKSSGLGGMDRVLGILFGALRGVIIVLVVLMFARKLLSVNEDPWWEESVLIPYVLALEDTASNAASKIYTWVSGIRGES